MLDDRLLSVANMVIHGKPAADIGADHALLSIYLIKKQIASRVIVGEFNTGPYQKARAAVAASSCGGGIEVRQGDGLQVLAEGEVASVIIAGMGGETIVNIMAQDLNKSRSFTRFIIQPMTKPHVIRAFLAQQGWPVLDEKVVRINDRYFLTISSCPGNEPYELSSLEMDIGPRLLKSSQPEARSFQRYCLHKYLAILQNMELSSGVMELRRADYKQRIIELEGILDESQG